MAQSQINILHKIYSSTPGIEKHCITVDAKPKNDNRYTVYVPEMKTKLSYTTNQNRKEYLEVLTA